MRLASYLLFSALIGASIACGISGTESSSRDESSSKGSDHAARKAADQILAAIHNGDPAAIKPFLNETNRNKLSDAQIREYLQEAKEQIGGTRTVSELREGRTDDTVYAKIREVDGEVFVVVLTLEDGKYLFEDINSPSTDSYESLPAIE